MTAAIHIAGTALSAIARKIITGIVVAVLLWLTGFAIFNITVLTMHPQKQAQTTDVIMVFTGGNGRVETGLSLFAAGKARHLFITGVFPHVTEGEITALWKGDTALPPCCITIDHKATSTTQNAAEARAWMKTNSYASVRLVTSDYHMIRAAMELRHALPGIDIITNPVRNPEHRITKPYYWQMVFFEYHKTLFRMIRLGMTPQKPMERHGPS